MKAGFSAFVLLATLTPCLLMAERFDAPLPGDDLIGRIGYARVEEGETLLDVGREYGIGYRDIVSANPGINRWVPPVGARVTIPAMHVLPDVKREGLVLNLSELRLYYFPPDEKDSVYSYPVSVGRMDWKTPLGLTKVVRKETNPAWRPPPSIRAEHAAEDEYLPAFIPGGDPENPLGLFALRLGLPSYLIHGTDEAKSFGIGMQVTHGCIRLYPEDIEDLFHKVKVGAPVRIINQPIKAGWLAGDLYLQITRPLEEEAEESDIESEISYADVMDYLDRHIPRRSDIDPAAVKMVLRRADGLPAVIGEVAAGAEPLYGMGRED